MIVEGDNTIYVNPGDAEGPGNFQHCFLGKISELLLNLLQDRDKISAFLTESFENLLSFLYYPGLHRWADCFI